MEKNAFFYWKLFQSTFTLSAFTFGGGYVIVPLMQKHFVQKLKWLDEEEVLDLVAIAQSAPGPIAINTSIILGYRLAGIRGALLATFGTVLPPLIIITVISYFYAAFRDNPVISALLLGMQAGVAAVILHAIYEMGSKIISKKEWLPILILLAAFIADFFFNVNILFILLASAIAGVWNDRHKRKATERGAEK